MNRIGLWLGLLIVGGTALMAIFGPWIDHHDPFLQDLDQRLIPPSWMEGGQPDHVFGTDQLGRDDLARLLYGARISLLIGGMTVVCSGITTRLSIPLILVALAVVSLIGTSLTVVVATLGLLLWERFAVVSRVSTMQVRNQDFVAAAWSAGCSRTWIMLREVLPNILSPLAVVATLEMALAILLEAALSFLGLGVPPPLPSWGLMIAEAKDYMFFSPWVIMVPGLALCILVFGINLLGDGLRDLLRTGRTA